ncbi:hypothetical protein SAMN05443245_4004 [Paraburkholderia fungorum]|uniref:Uncharacterized protein n=1 Tax=Paraburkholderia fungorum TaxID=134537 RepID=A0A1H1HKE8_9BURK|nr:hypothetical protein SAMN05443245_4004 [Paraburkholderia fungorum]
MMRAKADALSRDSFSLTCGQFFIDRSFFKDMAAHAPPHLNIASALVNTACLNAFGRLGSAENGLNT